MPVAPRLGAWFPIAPPVTRSLPQRWFTDEVIVTCVRWSLRFKLSYRDLSELARELGVRVAPSTILRWVVCYALEFEKCWQAHERPVGDSWRCDETYLKVRGQWVYLYRAVDKHGKTVESYLEPYPRPHRRQGVFPEGASPSRRPTGDYSGRFRAHACRFASDGHEQRI